MSLSFGWENYLSPYQREAPSDFEVHRAQMRHYDAWTSEYGKPGAQSSGVKRNDTGVGTSSGGAAPVSKPKAKPVEQKPSGHTVVSGPDAGGVSSSDVAEKLNPVMEPDVTRIKFGLDWEPNPWFSNVETGAEERYGDIGGAVIGIGVAAADLVFNADRWTRNFHTNVVAPRREQITRERETLVQDNFFDPFDPVTFGHGGYRTGGGF